MKELRDEKFASIADSGKLAAFGVNSGATKPISASIANIDAMAGLSKVVDMPVRHLLRDIKIIKKDGTKEEYDVNRASKHQQFC